MAKTIGYEKKIAKSARSEKEEKSWLNDTKALRLCVFARLKHKAL
ncbi:hypothetical protein [Flavobacterium endoglycinae]|nr:hypothetical protein [Flavobacterium endoglycinae]